MLKRQNLLLCLLALFILPIAGQDFYKIDSIQTRLSEQPHDSVRSRLMFEIAAEILMKDTLVAIEYLENAKRIVSNLNDTRGIGQYYQILGKMHSHHGQYSLAILDFDRALAYFSESDDQISYFETVKEKGNVHLFMAKYTEALIYYNSALEFYQRHDIFIGISRCLNNMGIIHKNRGEYVEALSVYEESVMYLDTVRDARDISEAYINMGNVLVHLGNYRRGIEYFEKALVISERGNHQKNISKCLANAGVIQNKCNNYGEALSLYQRSLNVARSINDHIQESNSLINIGTNYADMGQLQRGIEYVEKGMAIKMELGDERAISNCHIHLAEIHVMMEDFDQAIELFRTAIPEKELLKDQEGLVRCYLGLGSVMLEREKFIDARRMTEQALVIALKINSLEYISHGYRIKREISLALGDYRSAYQFAMKEHLYNDSLLNEATSKAVMGMEFRHHSKVLEQENENLHIQSDLTTALLRKRNAIYYSILGITFLLATGLILVGYFLRRLRNSSLKLEEQNLIITRQNLRLDNLNKNKDQLMSIIAHDLRGTIGNQLTAIEVLHRIEGNESADFDRKKLFGHLKHSASYSLELLENLLHWSRLKENESYYHPEALEVESLISNCISLFDETANNKNLSFHMDLDASAFCMVDRIMMETIIRNLISNAIKFSNPGGQITLSTTMSDDKLFFKITDQGIGMTEEQINKISNNGGFTRRGTDNEKGAGIGLTLVREFTTIHKGVLNITSKPNEGSIFEVVIPCIN